MAPCQSGEEPYFFLGYITSSPSRYFNPRAPHGARPFRRADRPSHKARNFNPRAPYGARPGRFVPRYFAVQISIHAPHTGRDVLAFFSFAWYAISIHAPHTGRDNNKWVYGVPVPIISIHAPHTGRDCHRNRICQRHLISIHAPHTGRDSGVSPAGLCVGISIHAPHTGRDYFFGFGYCL